MAHDKTPYGQESAEKAPDTGHDTHAPDGGKTSLGSSFIYTLNHTLACTYYDIPGPFIAAAFSTGIDRLKGKESTGPWWRKAKEKHDHAHGHGHGHDHDHDHAKGSLGGAFWDSTKHWIVGEMAGDFGAILPTVAIQHYAPGFMGMLRKGLEPVFGPVFRRSANRAARQQATAFGMQADEATIKARADDIYEHEMAHLPLAFVWTPISAAINIAVQKNVMGSDHSWGNLITSKAATASLATGTVFAVRSLAPTQVQKFETGMNDKIITPAMQRVGKLVGMDEERIRDALDNSESPKEWADRIRQEKEPASLVRR